MRLDQMTRSHTAIGLVLLAAALVSLEMIPSAAIAEDNSSIEVSPHVCGIVIDPQGAPIPDAQVRIRRGSADAVLQTGRSGKFSFNKLDTGAYELQVQAPGFSTARSRIQVVSRSNKCKRPLRIGLLIGITGNPVVEPPHQK